MRRRAQRTVPASDRADNWGRMLAKQIVIPEEGEVLRHCAAYLSASSREYPLTESKVCHNVLIVTPHQRARTTQASGR